jgi:hypothetical protein
MQMFVPGERPRRPGARRGNCKNHPIPPRLDPSIHLPRASRLTLQNAKPVTSRAQRVLVETIGMYPSGCLARGRPGRRDRWETVAVAPAKRP